MHGSTSAFIYWIYILAETDYANGPYNPKFLLKKDGMWCKPARSQTSCGCNLSTIRFL
jgi:hypothetical protein